MAARLVYIKTVSLLPRHEEAEDLKKELTGQLLEYQACKAAAARLALQNNGYNIFVRQPEKLPIDKTYMREHLSDELLFAYLDVIGKAKAQAAARRHPLFPESLQNGWFRSPHVLFLYCGSFIIAVK